MTATDLAAAIARQHRLHKRLVAHHSTAELKRKAEKAGENKARLWTQEELDYAERWGVEMAVKIKWE